MKNINKIFVMLALIPFFTSCDEEPTKALEDIIKEDKGYLPVIATFTLASPAEPIVQPGMESTFDLRFWSEGSIESIEFWMIKDEAETLISEQAYSPAYSMVTRTDSLIFNYTIPGSLQAGDTLDIQARVFNEGLEEYPATASITLMVPE